MSARDEFENYLTMMLLPREDAVVVTQSLVLLIREVVREEYSEDRR